jgi:hypothetical protein
LICSQEWCDGKKFAAAVGQLHGFHDLEGTTVRELTRVAGGES